MKVEKALSSFRKDPHRHNCPQAVAWAFDREDLLEPLAQCGGGKAKEGLCGAAYAAALIVGPDREDQLLEAFASQCGSMACKELKKTHHVPCETCVSRAVRLVEPYIL